MSYTKKIVNINLDEYNRFSYNGYEYELRITEYKNVGGYAPVIFIDKNTHEHFYSDGYIQLNGNTFITKWEPIYDSIRDNWICSKDLIITVL